MATDLLSPPHAEVETPLPDLVKLAWDTRPDVRQARLQIVNGERQVAGSANAAKPEIDIYGTYQTRGVVLPGLLDDGGKHADREHHTGSGADGRYPVVDLI